MAGDLGVNSGKPGLTGGNLSLGHSPFGLDPGLLGGGLGLAAQAQGLRPSMQMNPSMIGQRIPSSAASSTPQQAVNAGTDQKIPSVSLPVEKSPVRPVQNEKAIGRFKRLLYLLTGIYLVLCLAAMAAIALNKWDRPTENMLKLLWIAGVFSGVVMIRIFISKYAARHPEMRDADAGPKKY